MKISLGIVNLKRSTFDNIYVIPFLLIKMMEESREDVTYYWARESAIPMRAHPAESAEMINQLIFGDTCRKLEEDGSWTKIKHTYDGYEGWVDTKMLEAQDLDAIDAQADWHMVVFAAVQWEDGTLQHLPAGAFVPLIDEGNVWRLAIGQSKGIIMKGSSLLQQQARHKLVEVGSVFMNTPYLWGGCSGFGIDCSGLMQRVYRSCGIFIPRDSSVQAKQGVRIDWTDREAGDLAFFTKPNKSHITHVGMVGGDDKIIHASGKVRVDQLTEKGIIHSTNHKLSYHLVNIQRC